MEERKQKLFLRHEFLSAWAHNVKRLTNKISQRWIEFLDIQEILKKVKLQGRDHSITSDFQQPRMDKNSNVFDIYIYTVSSENVECESL